jgi:hypothetical protein
MKVFTRKKDYCTTFVVITGQYTEQAVHVHLYVDYYDSSMLFVNQTVSEGGCDASHPLSFTKGRSGWLTCTGLHSVLLNAGFTVADNVSWAEAITKVLVQSNAIAAYNAH